VIDTAWTDNTGAFEIENYLPERMICRMTVDGDRMNYYILSIHNEDVNIDASWKEPGNPKVEGSPATNSLFGLMDALRQFDAEARTMNDSLMDLKSKGLDSIVDAKLNQIQANYYAIFKNYIDTTAHAQNAILAMESMYDYDFEYAKAYYNKTMNSADSASIYLKEMGEKIKMREALLAQSVVGKPFIDIVQPDPKGNMRKLSDLKGKVVLIDFWASWCVPCRDENPNVVKAYNKYKSQGFTVFSVSLDSDKNKWLNAIKADGLIWENHVCLLDDKNNQAASDYHVTGIPMSFLVDKNGIIVAENLRGGALEKKLAELLPN
jgi:thiol-disulfide isomerase/thioredoxin